MEVILMLHMTEDTDSREHRRMPCELWCLLYSRLAMNRISLECLSAFSIDDPALGSNLTILTGKVDIDDSSLSTWHTKCLLHEILACTDASFRIFMMGLHGMPPT